MYKFLAVFLVACANVFASNLFVETLDEQRSSDNLLVFRFRINNGAGPLDNAVLTYCLQKSPGKNVVVDNYYVGNTHVRLRDVDSASACVEFAMDYVPAGVYPDQGGYSVGIHYSDWSPRNKGLDFSKPQSASFTRAENVALYVNEGLVYGNEPVVAEPPHIDVKFIAFRPDNDESALAFVDVKNLGNRSVSPDSLYFRDSKNVRVRALKKTLDVGGKVRVYFDSLPSRVAIGKSGELLMEYGNTSFDYIAWGAPGHLSLSAHESGIWDDASDYVKDYGENDFGFVPNGDGLFYGRTNLEANNSYAWMVYSEYDSETYEEYLPDATPFVLPNGISVALKESEPMRFAWNRVPYANQYRLVVLSAKDSSLVYEKTYSSNVADVDLPVGEYLWIVQAANSQKPFKPIPMRPQPILGKDASNPLEKALHSFAGTLIRIVRELRAEQYVEYVRISGPNGPNDTIVSSNGRKDTRLLNVSWGEYADIFGWDTIHSPVGPGIRDLDDDEGYRCWAIVLQELNHFYTTKDGKHGDLTLDEIIANVNIHWDTMELQTGVKREKPELGSALAAFRVLRGGDAIKIAYGLTYALKLDSVVIFKDAASRSGKYDGLMLRKSENIYYNQDEKHWNFELVIPKWKSMLNNGKPIYVGVEMSRSQHAMIVDGYRIDSIGELQFHFINTDNYGTNRWCAYLDEEFNLNNALDFFLSEFIEFDTPTDVALTDPNVHNDTDSDGVMDFDEKYRFDSYYDNPDSDGDSIDDKTEIHSYVIREKVSYDGVRINGGVSEEKWADVDGDGKRAENDKDSDGDDIEDGDEDLNHNGYVDAGETDPYIPKSGIPDFNIPGDIALYAIDFLRVNDGVKCRFGRNRPECDVASEQESDYAVILGVGVCVKNIYSKGKVWLRNNAKVSQAIRYYEPLDNVHLHTEMQEGASFQMEYPVDVRVWPYAVPPFVPKENFLKRDSVIRFGETYVLQDGDAFRNLKVESGGTLLLSTGEMVVDNLQLDANSDVFFTDPGYATVLHVNESIKWNGTIKNPEKDTTYIARGFKLYYYGTSTFDVAGGWQGTLIAPNAKVILGQNHNKVIYGQFLAYQLVVHQYSTIIMKKFNPLKPAASSHQELVFKED